MTRVQNVPERADILAVTANHTTITFNELLRQLSTDETRDATTARIKAMLRDGQLKEQNGEIQANTDAMREGKVVKHPKGFGFLVIDGDDPDWFIPYADMERCFPGEVVIASPISHDQRGTTARIVGRKNMLQNVSGKITFNDAGVAHFTLNDDHTLPVALNTDNLGKVKATDGMWVIGDFTAPPSGRTPHTFRISSITHTPSPVDQIRYRAVQNHQFPIKHTAECEALAGQLLHTLDEAAVDDDVVDLTSTPFVSIDGASSEDLDDLVYAKPLDGGRYELWVAIADVSRYITPNSPLDEAAFQRATSVYTPGKSFPMLPKAIAHDLCSMLPEELRYALVVKITLSSEGEIANYTFMSAKTMSAHRFTYQQVEDMMQRDVEPMVPEEEIHRSTLQALYEIDTLSRRRGAEQGSMEIDRDEPKFLFDDSGDISGFTSYPTLRSHKIIESAMVYANVAAARFLESHYGDALYRHHPGLQDKGLEALNTFLSDKGLAPLTTECSGLACNQRRHALSNDDEVAEFERLLRGAMTFARYSTNKTSHFGMALPAYTHFTSPIRRYGDILVHRMIKHKLGEHAPVTVTSGQANHISERAYEASMAERDCCDMLCARWWSQQPLEQRQRIPATLRGANDTMLFFSLDNTPVDGGMWRDDFEACCDEPSLVAPGLQVYVNITDIDVLGGRIRLALAET